MSDSRDLKEQVKVLKTNLFVLVECVIRLHSLQQEVIDKKMGE